MIKAEDRIRFSFFATHRPTRFFCMEARRGGTAKRKKGDRRARSQDFWGIRTFLFCEHKDL